MGRSVLSSAALAAAVSFPFLTVPARAQTPEGSLFGSVRTVDGAPLAQLRLKLEGPGGEVFVFSGLDGRYRADSLPAGEWQLTLTAPGLVADSPLRANVSGETRLDVVLAPAPVREHVVVSATRGEAALSTLGTATGVVDHERLVERAAPGLLDLLAEQPGVAVARAGSLGQQGSAFLRGGESNMARVLIDGVAVNEPGGAYDFSAQLPLELERVEVVRGAASSLYGTDAIAGAIQLVTRRAAADAKPALGAELEGGSFDWRRAKGGSYGRTGALDWNLGVQRLTTDNEQPNSRFEQTAAAAALGLELTPSLSLQAVLRGQDSEVGTPGQVAYGRPDLDAYDQQDERVASGALRRTGGRASHELRLGYGAHDRLSLNPEDSGSYLPSDGVSSADFPSFDYPNPDGFQNDIQRFVAGYKADVQLDHRHLLSAGVDYERESGEIGDRRDVLLSPVRDNAGVYVQDRIVAGRAFLTLGGRVEHNASYGWSVVPRGAVALRLGAAGRATTLRATAGAGVKEPSFLQSFGLFDYARGNPDLAPERSRTYDLGVEQRLFDDRLRVEATAFHHDYLDQIAYSIVSFTPFLGSYENLGRTRGRGLELSLDAAPLPLLRLAASYTLLDGEVLASASASPLYAPGQPLLRRPKHQGSLWARLGSERWSLSASLLAVGERADSDFLGIGIDENPGYTRLDLRGRVRVTRGVELMLAADNLTDARYQEVLGYPALGRSLRAGLRLATDGR